MADFTPRVGALSGPTFAKEVARGDPTAITIASRDIELAETVQREFSDPRFRVYTNGGRRRRRTGRSAEKYHRHRGRRLRRTRTRP